MRHHPYLPLIILTALLAVAALLPTRLAADEAKMLIRVDISSPDREQTLSRLPFGLDVASVKPRQYADIVIAPSQLWALQAAGLTFTTLMKNPADVAPYSGKAAYHTYNTVRTELKQIAADHPGIARLDTIATAAQGGRVWCLKISSNPAVDDNTKLGVLFMGNHHAREWMTVEAPLYIANYLTNNYGLPGYDSVTTLVNNREFYIIPTVNPDGFKYDSGGYYSNGKLWRKNRHVNGGGVYGVDLNRGYDGSQDGDIRGDWGGTINSYTSPDSSNDVFCGFAPSGEPEEQAVMNLVKAHNIVTSISFHSYAEAFMWPLGYVDSTVKKAPDSIVMRSTGQKVAARMRKYNSTQHYDAYQSSDLYPTTGDSDGWIYGFGMYQLGRIILPFTPEVDTAFYTPPSHIDSVCLQCKNGAIYLAWLADSLVQQTSPPPVLPPPVTRVQGNGTGFTLTWRRLNPAANAMAYELQELTGFSDTSSGAEATADANVTLNGFVRSTAQKHAGTYSFYTSYGNYIMSSLATAKPHPVTSAADSFRFWTYQNMGTWERLYVEASVDGRAWTQLGKLTGTRTSWARFAYSLAAFNGKSVFLRARYVSNSNTTSGRGVYIDDISPAARFTGAASLSNTIADTSYAISHSSGTYHYRVRGYNVKRGWGDWSQTYKVVAPVMAVEFTGLQAADGQEGIDLAWRTESETACYQWQIERSSEANGGYEMIGSISGHGTSGQPHQYGFVDAADLMAGIYYYRLIEVDLTGNRSWYGPVSVNHAGRGFPYVLELERCHPNPARGATTISFTIPARADTRLVVYNALGQAVRTLASGTLPAGHCTAVWDGRDGQGRPAAAGIYYCRLSAAGQTAIQRLVLIR